MMRSVWTVLSIIATCFLASCPSNAQQPKPLTAREIANKFKYSVFTIQTDKGTGTGFILLGNIITCYHVIDDAKAISLSVPGRPAISLTSVSGLSKSADLAKCPLPERVGNTVDTGLASNLHIGDKLFVVGSPRGLDQSITEGILSARRTENGMTMLQLSAAVSPGSSGSPVIDEFGKVVGVVTSQFKDSQQLNFAVAIEHLYRDADGIPLSSVNFGDEAPDTSLGVKPPDNGFVEVAHRFEESE